MHLHLLVLLQQLTTREAGARPVNRVYRLGLIVSRLVISLAVGPQIGLGHHIKLLLLHEEWHGLVLSHHLQVVASLLLE